MFCPKCATANTDDTKFCRSCGSNLSLVPQAMTGQLPESRRSHRHKKQDKKDEEHPPNLSKGIAKFMTGMGFIVVAVAVYYTSPGGHSWWWAMLFPAFSLMGGGIASIVGALTTNQIQSGPPQTAMPPVPSTGELPAQPQVYNHLPPPSVTEGTTRHLDPAKDRYEKNR